MSDLRLTVKEHRYTRATMRSIVTVGPVVASHRASLREGFVPEGSIQLTVPEASDLVRCRVGALFPFVSLCQVCTFCRAGLKLERGRVAPTDSANDGGPEWANRSGTVPYLVKIAGDEFGGLWWRHVWKVHSYNHRLTHPSHLSPNHILSVHGRRNSGHKLRLSFADFETEPGWQ